MQSSLSHKWKYLPFSQTLLSEGCLFIAVTNQPINLPMDQARQMCSICLVHQYMHAPLLTSAVRGGRTGLFVFGWCPQVVTKPQSHCRRELTACCFLHDKAFCEWGGCGNSQVLTSKALLLCTLQFAATLTPLQWSHGWPPPSWLEKGQEKGKAEKPARTLAKDTEQEIQTEATIAFSSL